MAPLSPTEIAFEQSHINEAVGPRTIGVSCMFVVLCSSVLGGRFYARRLRKAGLESDDYLAVAAHVSAIIQYQKNLLTEPSQGFLSWNCNSMFLS